MLTRRFTPQGITRSTVILAQEVTKLLLAALMLYITTGGSPVKAGALKGTFEIVNDTPSFRVLFALNLLLLICSFVSFSVLVTFCDVLSFSSLLCRLHHMP